MEPEQIAIEGTTTVMNPVAFDLLTPLIDFLFGNGGPRLLEATFGFTNTVWTGLTIFSYIVSIILLFIYIYAATERRQLHEIRMNQIRQREKIYDERFRSGPKNDRLADINQHIISDNPNDWKLAIIEADIILDETLKKAGYAGVSLGERLKSISPNQMISLDDAWQAHKVRNQIAHGGADFVLTRRLAEDTIKQYRRVFAELGVV